MAGKLSSGNASHSSKPSTNWSDGGAFACGGLVRLNLERGNCDVTVAW